MKKRQIIALYWSWLLSQHTEIIMNKPIGQPANIHVFYKSIFINIASSQEEIYVLLKVWRCLTIHITLLPSLWFAIQTTSAVR